MVTDLLIDTYFIKWHFRNNGEWILFSINGRKSLGCLYENKIFDPNLIHMKKINFKGL